ncbi:DUF58 domain-containing protein [Thermosynechococcaceae cyanobacterium BACA0444]|uniref:DUF58 domain-containing protein n=1 Tax=Pseudocalidococcus azoricus BACA0444 TaxID=2918990 RepID=A0AAE4JXZ6_9CYAN|nr:DUF58 domain-containing protein [Pseudocalidococcus azoricus]MDS3860444.1 DUF58 domain-containing protein [Pseudocalidococcus azoricus BACA0444]
MIQRLNRWLERQWVTPAFGALLLGGLALFFFGAAVNSMSGWLYVMTGIIVALLLVGALTPARMIRGLVMTRLPIRPVSVGDVLTLELELSNPSQTPRALITLKDHLPPGLAQQAPPPHVIADLPTQTQNRYVRKIIPTRRGIYHWEKVTLRTAAPLGLFWCQRAWSVPATAVVYPIVLPLQACPLLDQLGQETSQRWVDRQYQRQLATEGLTRSLRPYRWGDALRLVHWRTSARYGELRVRELDALSGGMAVMVSLDVSGAWLPDEFEQAVMAAAAIYFYARKQNIPVELSLGDVEHLINETAILRALAAIQPQPQRPQSPPPIQTPILWLTTNPTSLSQLSPSSSWLLWPGPHQVEGINNLPMNQLTPGRLINPGLPLQPQLERQLDNAWVSSL